jgi:hypothetical protein
MRSAEVPATTGCCPPFERLRWDDKEVRWRDKPFVVDEVACVLAVPVDMARTIRRLRARVPAANVQMSGQPIVLSAEKSAWRADVFIEVGRDVPGATMARLSGTFLTKVFEGPYRDAGVWMRRMREHVAARGRALERLYLGYALCPSCARAYGASYVVLFAKVRD